MELTHPDRLPSWSSERIPQWTFSTEYFAVPCVFVTIPWNTRVREMRTITWEAVRLCVILWYKYKVVLHLQHHFIRCLCHLPLLVVPRGAFRLLFGGCYWPKPLSAYFRYLFLHKSKILTGRRCVKLVETITFCSLYPADHTFWSAGLERLLSRIPMYKATCKGNPQVFTYPSTHPFIRYRLTTQILIKRRLQ